MYRRSITLIHPSFEIVGGAERVALKFMEAVAEEGLPINIITFNSIGIRRFLGDLSSKTHIRLWEFPYLIARIPSINKGVIQGLMLHPILMHLRLKHSIIVNTKFNEMPTLADIIYIHYPFYFVAAKNPLDKSLTEGPALGKSVLSHLYATYVRVSGIIGSRISWDYIENASKVLFNSIYTYTLFRIYTAKHSNKFMILNPPIDSTYFKTDIQEKEEIIVMRTKGMHPKIVTEIVLKLAQTLRKWNIYIIGFANNQYYEALKQKLENVSNVKILLNINEETKQRLLSRAMLYIHLTPYEHFGILIGEALASGCKVVAHKFSGIVHDIALHHPRQVLERCINVYENFQELSYIINNLVNDKQFDPELCRSLVASFKEDIFKEKVKRVIADVAQ